MNKREFSDMQPVRTRAIPTSADGVVIGGGSAGIVAAKTASGFGARVVLVEHERTGGDCLWTGCVPSKSLIAAASAAAAIRRAPRLGIETSAVTVDFSRVMNHVHSAIEHIAPIDSPDTVTKAGVCVVSGSAGLTGPSTLVIGTEQLTFGQAILATGARPTIPDLPGLDEVDYLTSETIWQLSELPARLLVLGGGTIGCELAQAFSRLGSAVSIVESADSLVPREDREAATILARSLISDGVDVLTAANAQSITSTTLTLTGGRRIEFDRVLVATGRTPRTASIGLDDAGVALDPSGYVIVDEHLRTSNPRIWAAGDLTGHPQFTHTAGVHGSIAATNAVLGLRRTVDRTGIPRVTFTDPEIAAVGIDVEAASRIPGLHVRTLGHEHVDRAVTEGRTDGFTKLVIDRKHRIVGATIVGPRAGETLGEMALAVKLGLRTRDIAGVTHPYPTYNDGPWTVTVADIRAQLARPATSRVIAVLAGARRMWLRARQEEPSTPRHR